MTSETNLYQSHEPDELIECYLVNSIDGFLVTKEILTNQVTKIELEKCKGMMCEGRVACGGRCAGSRGRRHLVKGSEVGAFAFVGARRAARRGGGVQSSAY